MLKSDSSGLLTTDNPVDDSCMLDSRVLAFGAACRSPAFVKDLLLWQFRDKVVAVEGPFAQFGMDL